MLVVDCEGMQDAAFKLRHTWPAFTQPCNAATYSLQPFPLLVLVGIGQIISFEYHHRTQRKDMFLRRCR